MALKRQVISDYETQPRKMKLYVDSSRQSVREMVHQWKRISAERRAIRAARYAESGQQSFHSLGAVHRPTSGGKSSANPSRRGSRSTPRTSTGGIVPMPTSRISEVKVTDYAKARRESMTATQIGTENGISLLIHKPVNGHVAMRYDKNVTIDEFK